MQNITKTLFGTNFLNQLNPLTMIIICIMIITFLIIIMALNGSIRKTRIHYASVMGKSEHFAGRLLGFLLFFDIILAYFGYIYILYPLIITFIVWVIYLFSHTLEKSLYGRGLR